MIEAPVDPVAEIDRRSPVVTRPLVIALVAVALIVLAGITWAVFGHAPQTVEGNGIVQPAGGYLEVGTTIAGIVESVAVSPGDHVDAGQLLAVVNVDGKAATLSGQVVSPRAGRVIDVVALPGRITAPGDPIAYLEPDDVALQVKAFLPAGGGKSVTAGMPAQVQVANAPRSQYGVIEAQVAAISPAPITRERLLFVLGGNADLADYFLAQGPVIEATLSLVTAPTPTGYDWSIGEGPAFAITSGALAQVWVITANQPIVRWLTR